MDKIAKKHLIFGVALVSLGFLIIILNLPYDKFSERMD